MHIALGQYRTSEALSDAIGKIQPSFEAGDPEQGLTIARSLMPERTDPRDVGLIGDTGNVISNTI